MTLLSIADLSKEFSGEELFKPVTFQVKEHDKIAILGANGSGKSTLLKMILNQVEKTSGTISLSKNVSIGYLSQDVIEDPKNTLYQEALTVFKDLIKEEKALHELSEKIASSPNDQTLLNEYSKKETEFQNKGGYDYSYKIAMILNIFSFKRKDYDREISTFSGGEKAKVAFAKLLLMNPDILILDEPTNHLDIISIEWLEQFLSEYQGAILFVSHDVAFVKNVANRILEIEDKVFTMYNCPYDYYLVEKKNRYENLLSAYHAQEALKEKYRKFITFYMPKPRFASRAKDRVKKLDRLEQNGILDPTHHDKKISMRLSGNVREGKKIFDFSDVSIGYDKPLISHISFSLEGKDHLAIMGENGSGKSTFGKVILNELAPLSGNIRRYFHLTSGVLRQDIRTYQSEETLFSHFRNRYQRLDNTEIYNGLARYGFSYEEANEKKLSNLSGGELMRVELYQLSLEDYDLLLLDEPTNHLDMLSSSVLADALNEYQGTLIIISHDRDFIDKTCDKILYFHNDKSYFYPGSYEEFKNERLKTIMAEEEKLLQEENKQRKGTIIKPKNERKRSTREAPEKIIAKIDKLESEKTSLSECFYQEEFYSSKSKIDELNSQLGKIEEELKRLYELLESAL